MVYKAFLPVYLPSGQAQPPPHPNRNCCYFSGIPSRAVQANRSMFFHAFVHSCNIHSHYSFHFWETFHSIIYRISLFQIPSRKKQNTAQDPWPWSVLIRKQNLNCADLRKVAQTLPPTSIICWSSTSKQATGLGSRTRPPYISPPPPYPHAWWQLRPTTGRWFPTQHKPTIHNHA